MIETVEEKRKKLRELSAPIMEYLNNNEGPHTKVVIDWDSAEILEGKFRVVTEDYILD